MAKKKKFGAILEKQTKQIPVVKQKAPKTISTNVSTDGMRSAVSSTAQSVAKSARQKAEEDRSARMRQGLSSVVRSSFNRQMSRPTYINKSTVNRLNQLNKTVTNPLAPIKQKQVTGNNGVGGQRLFSKERSLLNNTKFVTGGQGVGGKTVVNSPIGRVKSSVLAPVKEDIQNNYYDAVRKVGMKGSRNERKVYVPLSQRDENGQISTNQRRLENAARGGNRKAQVEAALARTKAQTLSGHTYDQYVNAELNKKGLLGQDYILRSKDPSKEAMDYRKRYGFDKEALEAVQAIANNTPASGDYTERFNGQDNGSAIDRLKFGFGESYRARNIEDTLRRQYGVELSDEDQAKLDAVRDSGGYMVGNMLGQASQFAMTAPLSPLVEQGLMARMGLKGGRAAINTTKDAVKYAIARIGADQVVSAPVNMIDALKGEDTKEVALRFFYNTGLDVLFGGLLEIPSLRTNAKFVKAIRANDAANAMEEGAEQVAAKVAAEKQLSEAISSFNPVEQQTIRNRMRQLAEEADIQRDINRGFAGDTSASNLDIYNEELPSELSRNEARRLVDTEPTPNELVRERAGNFRNNSEMLFQDGGIASREAVNASIRHGVQDSDYLTWRMAYDAARRNGMVEDDAIRYADDYIVSSAERARLVNREPVDTLAVANEEARRADSLLNAANGRETRDSLLDAANNRESSDALLDASNRRRANEPTILSSGEAPRSNGTFGRDVTAKYNESLEADKNLEQAIANYDKPLTELSDEESKLWDDTYGEAYRRYSEYPDARQRAMQEADDAVKQRRNIELAQAATRADEAQRAINDLHRTQREAPAEEPSVPKEEPPKKSGKKRKSKPKEEPKEPAEEPKATSPKEEEPKTEQKEQPKKEQPKEESKPKEEPKEESKAKEEPKENAEPEEPKEQAEKSDKEKLFYNAPKPYTPKGGGKDEKAWKAIRKSYEKNSKEQLELKKQQIKKAVSNGTMPKSQGDERIKLIDNILEQREYYRYGTKKEFNGKKISQTVDTGRAAENIPDAVKAQIEDDVVAGEAGIKMGQNPKAALRDAKSKVNADPEAIRIKIDKATPAAREGKLPTGYDNLQEYYAEANALLDHYSEKISDLESKGLTDSDEYKKMIDDTANFVEGVFSTRSQEGYSAVQYNMMVRSNAEVRVAVVERSLRQIEEEYANELEKVAKKNGTPISKDDQIHITLSKESRKRLREIDPDNPLDMAITLHKISVETWNQVPADKHEVADAIRKTSMLLNPKTHLRNVIGNTLMIPARIMKDLLGAPIEKWAIRKGYMRADQATKAFVNRFSRSDKPYYDVARAVWKEWKDVIRGDAKMFDSVPTSASKLIGKRPIGEGRVLTAGIENPKTWRKAVDWIIKKNGSALEKSDALMMRIHFTDSFAQACKARNLDPSKLTKEQLMDVIDAATGEAQRATFRDASEVAKTINGWKVYKKGDTFAQKVGRFSVNTTMPFVNTPINILRRSWDYSPAGLIHGGGEILQGIRKHNAKQVKKGIDRMCSGLTGSGVCLLGFYLGKNGNLTARLSEGSEGYYEQDQGFQEYSLNIGGEDGWSVSLSQFAPHTIPLFMGVELANMFDPNEEVNWKALPDVIGRVFDPTMDMSVMQGPMSVLKSIADSDSLGDAPLVAAMTIGTNYISQYIPTLSGQIARTIDPVRRDTSSLQENKVIKYGEKSLNKTKAKIPFASKTLEPYLDSWGNEQINIEGNPMKRFLYEVASPSYVRKKNITALDKEITRLNGIAADDEDKIIPKKFFGNTVSFDGSDVQVSKADLTTYNRVRGKAAYEAASELIETDAYKNASDAEKRKMIDKVFKDANTKGKQETLLKKGYSAGKVYTEGFEGGKKENADNVFNAGVAPKRYYELMTDKSVDLDGNGSKSQYEVYTYLQNTDLTDAQKAAIWNSYNKSWKNNPYTGGTIPTADGSKSGSKSGSNGSKRGRSGRRSSGGGSSKTKARAKTASEKRFAALQTGKAPTNAKGIEALSSSAKGLTKAQKKALVKLMQKKLEV